MTMFGLDDPHPATQEITIISRAKSGRDDDGNATRGSASRTVDGLYAPGGSSETTNDQQRVVSQEQVYIPDPPADLVINPTDQIQVQSVPNVTFEVAGDVQTWAPGLAVPLKRVSG